MPSSAAEVTVTADRDSNVNPPVTQVAKPLIMQNFKV